MPFTKFISALLVVGSLQALDSIQDKIFLIGSNQPVPLQIVPYSSTPAADNIFLKVVLPENGELMNKSPVSFQLKMINFSLGTTTKNKLFPGLREDSLGQSIRVVVDNKPYTSVGVLAEDSYNANLDVMRKNLSFKLSELDKGEHVIRVFPVTSFGECIKRYNNYDVSTFYVGSKKGTIKQDLSKPYLTYNEPQGEYKLKSAQDPILVDFFLSNCTLTREGFKVQISVDGEILGKLYQWTPYLLFGLKKGQHTIRLDLLDSSDQIVNGEFNSTERTITIK
jgi:hypothetical protein